MNLLILFIDKSISLSLFSIFIVFVHRVIDKALIYPQFNNYSKNFVSFYSIIYFKH
jgi:hypothetical protein